MTSQFLPMKPPPYSASYTPQESKLNISQQSLASREGDTSFGGTDKDPGAGPLIKKGAPGSRQREITKWHYLLIGLCVFLFAAAFALIIGVSYYMHTIEYRYGKYDRGRLESNIKLGQ